MKNINIRKVKMEDAEQFIKLLNYVWRITYKNIFPEEVFIDRELNADKKIKNFNQYYRNDDRHIVYVAEDDGKVVGLFSGRVDSDYEYFNQKGYSDLEAMYIHRDYQGYGIGSKFKNIFTNWLKEKGLTKFVLGVLKENWNARKVYEKWGSKLDKHTQPFIKLGVGYEEVFYTYELK